MAFNNRLKEARISNGLTQEQLAASIGVAKSTVTGYEKGNSEPNMLTIQKIMDALGIDANFLFQDEMSNMTELVISFDEKDLLKKYRDLDDHGKEMVDMVLEKEYERCTPDQPDYTEKCREMVNAIEKEETRARKID